MNRFVVKALLIKLAPYPVFTITLIFSLGILCGTYYPFSFTLCFAMTITLIAATWCFFLRKGIPQACLLIALFSLGICCAQNSNRLPNNHYSNHPDIPFIKQAAIQGIIASAPEENSGQYTFILQTRQISDGSRLYRCSGKILVRSKQNRFLRFQDTVELRGNLRYLDSSGFLPGNSFLSHLRRKHIHAYLYLSDQKDAAEILAPAKHSFIGDAYMIKTSLIALLSEYLTPVTASLVAAMLFGAKNNIPALVIDSMKKSGTIHILVISGLNVGLVISITLLVLKILRIPKKARFTISIPLIIYYCLMTQSNTPVLRASIMGIILLLARVARRESNLINATSLAALIILLIDPYQLLDIGFQLSFASVYALILLPERIKRLLKVPAKNNPLITFLLDSIIASLSAWIGTGWIIARNFGMVTPITVAANLCIVPLALLLTLCGITLIFFGLCAPPLAPFVALPSEATALLLLYLNNLLIRIPGAYFTFD